MLYAGYPLESGIRLRSLRPAAADAKHPAIRIVIRSASSPRQETTEPLWRHQWLEADGSLSLRVARWHQAAPDGNAMHLLQAPEQCDFLVDPSAGWIGVDACSGLAENTLEHLLLDQALPRLLAGRGHLVVHASVIRIGSRAVAFVGRSGRGKSTLAALFQRRGHPALCDDCALFDHHDRQASVTPSYPGLRLYSDSIEHALEWADESGPVSQYSDKQRVIALQQAAELQAPQPLAAIYLLDDPPPGGAGLAIEPVTPAAACMALVEHGFRLDPTRREETTRQLRLASAVAEACPTFLLRYPRDFDRQDALVEQLLRHHQRLPHTPATP